MKQPLGQKLIRKRKPIVEHVFGNIKMKAGRVPLLRRGYENARAEGSLHCLDYNFTRLMNVLSCGEIITLVEDYSGKYGFR